MSCVCCSDPVIPLVETTQPALCIKNKALDSGFLSQDDIRSLSSTLNDATESFDLSSYNYCKIQLESRATSMAITTFECDMTFL